MPKKGNNEFPFAVDQILLRKRLLQLKENKSWPLVDDLPANMGAMP